VPRGVHPSGKRNVRIVLVGGEYHLYAAGEGVRMGACVTLTITRGAGAGSVLRVSTPRRLIVGRGEDADLRLDDRFVSRRHALIEVSPPACRLQDLGLGYGGSTNVPHVNGQPARQSELRDGDVIEIGYTQMRLSVEVLPERLARCTDCGRETPGGSGDSAHFLCERCWERHQVDSRTKWHAVKVPCPSCGIDLSREANSDGRAAEFGPSVSYVCPACLPRGDLAIGDAVGDYELCRCLGEGGMGVVYLAYHRPTARLVALKRIQDVQDKGAVRRFAREVRLLRLLSHPGVVRFLDTNLDPGGAPFLVTEYIRGGNLEQHLERRGSLPQHVAVDLICQVLNGLDYLHAWPVIHRDIKPENILLSEIPGEARLVPKLTDFGVSRYYEQAGGTRLTKPGTRMGTLMFMPPEQVRDAAEARESADTYAVGVTLYYLMTGKYSFEFPTPAEIRAFQNRAQRFRSPDEAVREIMRQDRARHPFRIILSEDPIPALKRSPSLPKRLAAVVDRAVRKDPAKRYQSAAEFRTELMGAVR